MERVQAPVKSAFVTALLSVIAALLMAPSFGQAASQYSAPIEGGAAATPAAPGETQARKPTPYIVGGGESTFEKHPWLVQITLDGKAFCGGALVHPMLILTAAHCLYDQKDGLWWFQKGFMEAFTGRTLSEIGGEKLVLSQGWRAQNYEGLSNDWGFISLSSPSSRPVLKIAGANEAAIWRAGRSALVAGFGNISQGGNASPVLKELTVPLLSDSVCGASNSYGTSYNPAVMLCSGIVAGGSGTCQGDSGGALTVPIDGGGRRIVGVVSWGDGCAKPNKPTIYTRVAGSAVSAEINARAKEIAEGENFPGIYANSNVLGSGAKPAGCAAAQANAGNTQSALKSANSQLSKAKKAEKRTKKAAAKAKRAVSKAKRAAKKAPSYLKALSAAKLLLANAKLKKVSKQAKNARAKSKRANAAKRSAQSAAKTAASAAASACN